MSTPAPRPACGRPWGEWSAPPPAPPPEPWPDTGVGRCPQSGLGPFTGGVSRASGAQRGVQGDADFRGVLDSCDTMRPRRVVAGCSVGVRADHRGARGQRPLALWAHARSRGGGAQPVASGPGGRGSRLGLPAPRDLGHLAPGPLAEAAPDVTAGARHTGLHPAPHPDWEGRPDTGSERASPEATPSQPLAGLREGERKGGGRALSALTWAPGVGAAQLPRGRQLWGDQDA